jgi:aspartyl/glutamyl-tRNA(Asn/Gln) amidotransferase C subunit
MEFPIEKIASLAYLELTEQQKKSFESQLRDIMNYVDQLQKIPMTPEEANQMGAFHVLSAFYQNLQLDPDASLRDEQVSDETEATIFTNDDAVRGAPKTGGIPGALLFEVPSIIER